MTYFQEPTGQLEPNDEPADGGLVLVFLQFEHGQVKYVTNYGIVVHGKLWPREFDVASEIIRLYKSCRREMRKKEPES